jgi:hypothetical protein
MLASVCASVGGTPLGSDSACLFADCSKALEGTFRDEFNDMDVYSGTDGTLAWATDWQEINESDGPRRGDEQLAPDPLGGDPPPDTYQRRGENSEEGVLRQADLTGAVNVTLSFRYRRGYLDDEGDYVKVEVSASGVGGPWTEVARVAGPGHDSTYQDFSVDISDKIGDDFAIRFMSGPGNRRVDDVWFDEVQIECTP